jgi:hypothetical protein
MILSEIDSDFGVMRVLTYLNVRSAPVLENQRHKTQPDEFLLEFFPSQQNCNWCGR